MTEGEENWTTATPCTEQTRFSSTAGKFKSLTLCALCRVSTNHYMIYMKHLIKSGETGNNIKTKSTNLKSNKSARAAPQTSYDATKRIQAWRKNSIKLQKSLLFLDRVTLRAALRSPGNRKGKETGGRRRRRPRGVWREHADQY